jgi:hypothetical protein
MVKKYTEEQRAAIDARRDLLAEAARIMEEERGADIDKAAAILSTYSRRNIALILAQAEERGRQFPQAVAGFHAWRAAGRIIRKGSAGYFIYAPVIKEDAQGEPVRKGYRVTHVFDVADTDPIAVDSPDTLRELIAS